jgi:hypothetical protein
LSWRDELELEDRGWSYLASALPETGEIALN